MIKLCSQKYGIDYTETFLPVVRYESVKAILSISAKENYKLRGLVTVII